ncbi:DinB family protein [Aquimarina sp. 2201CG5-10]|uniref:DinB family protein n=1 Tax=Aquimarina callyspongiae TaxID=3098150 RepID=UPI002AB35366|nr:DUF1572 family protein [Aquimarina sp. 2201CG5-10]MDY8136230.1 DUF1572 family protein [Aquimarina sp. 2201CG5-10]
MDKSIIDVFRKIFKRNLESLKTEIALYKDEKQLWKVEKGVTNSAGNLCLHLIGNLNTFIAAQIGKSGYIRNRELEFTDKNVSRSVLESMIDETINEIEKSLDQLSIEQLREEYPRLIAEEKASTEYMLVHLATHLTYHLGQINYHRRLLDE